MGGIVAQTGKLLRGERTDRVLKVELGPGHVLRVAAHVVPAKQIGRAEQRQDNQPRGKTTDYPRQSPSSLSRVTGKPMPSGIAMNRSSPSSSTQGLIGSIG